MLLCGGNKGKKALTFYLYGGKVTIRQPGHRSPALLFCIPASPDYGARKINRNGSVRLKEIIKKISDVGIIPVVKLKDEKDALPLARALCDGGLPAAEVTFRTDAAENVIKAMAEAFRSGNLGIMDYYHMKNIEADTNMRDNIVKPISNK